MSKILNAWVCTTCGCVSVEYPTKEFISEYRRYNCPNDKFNTNGHGEMHVITPEVYKETPFGIKGIYPTEVKQWYRINGWNIPKK